jgi:predicted outer membrane repeat protein
MRTLTLATVVASAFTTSSNLHAESQIFSVASDYSTAYHSIQDAIDDAIDGDVVEVHPGFYFEQINTMGKAIHIQGLVYQDQRPVLLGRLDAHAPADMPNLPIMSIKSGEGASTIVSDLIFTRGFYSFGGALYISNASPSINDCSFLDNWGKWGGGAVYCRYSSANFVRCIFSENYCSSFGGAMYLERSPVTLQACFFDDNYVAGFGGGIYVNHVGGPVMRPSLYACFFLENKAQNTWSSRHIRGGWHDLGFCAFADDTVDSDDDGVPDDFEEGLVSSMGVDPSGAEASIDAGDIMEAIITTGKLGLYTPEDLDGDGTVSVEEFEAMLKEKLD